MSINELEYNLVPLGMPNILYAEKRDETPQPTSIHPTLKTLVIRLAKAKPKWRLVSTRRNRYADGVVAHHFTIYEGNEQLGTLWRDYNYSTHSEQVAFDNTRLRSNRQRGDATRTKDMNKAFKVITKTFGAKTTAELVAEGSKEALECARTVFNGAERNHHTALYTLTDAAQKFMVHKWEEFCLFAEAEGVPTGALERLPVAAEVYADALKVDAALKDNNGSVVILRDAEYIVTCKSLTTILSQSDLSPHLKRCVGMLKLAEDKQFVPGMGVRANATTFFVLPEDSTGEPAD